MAFNVNQPHRQDDAQIRASEIRHGYIKDLLDEYREHLKVANPERQIFWSRGRPMEVERGAPPTSQNKELAKAYRLVMRKTDGLTTYEDQRNYHLINSLIDKHNVDIILPSQPWACTQTQRNQFWRTISEEFADNARGTITMACDSSPPDTNLRLFEYPLFMQNKDITHVSVLCSEIIPHGYHAVMPRSAMGTVKLVDTKEWESDPKEKKNIRLPMHILPLIPPSEMPKMQWAESQKAQWYQTSRRHLMDMLKGKRDILSVDPNTNVSKEPSEYSLIDAEIRLLGEIQFSVRELERLEEVHKKITTTDLAHLSRISINREKARLADALKIVDQFPFIGDMRSPWNDLEKKYGEYHVPEHELGEGSSPKEHADKKAIYTQTLGHLFLRLDDQMPNSEKHKLWGAFEYYNYSDPNHHIKPALLGDNEAMEKYTETKIEQLLSNAHEKLVQPKHERNGKYNSRSVF